MRKGRSDLHVQGRKDKQSKVYTAKGPRDRRLRLSAYTAIQFYDVQDRLGYERPTKAVDWLINKAKHAIDKLNEQPSDCPPITAGIYSTSNSTKLVSNQLPNPTKPTKPFVQQPGAADHPWYAAFPQPSSTDNPNPFFQPEPHLTINNNIKCFFPVSTTSSLNLFEYTNADCLNHVMHRESLQPQDDLGLSLHLVQPESNLTRFLMNTHTMSQGTPSDPWHQDHHNIYTHQHDHGLGDCESSGFVSRCGYPARIYGDNQSEAN